MNDNYVLLIAPQLDYVKLLAGRGQKVPPSSKPVGLLYLASFLEAQGVAVKILDGQIHDLSDEILRAEILANRPIIVGIGCPTPLLADGLRIARTVKHTEPRTTVVMGGAHPTVLPQECFSTGDVDIVVSGEGEHTLWEILDARRHGRGLDGISGLHFLREGRAVSTPPRPFLVDLDSLPLPARHLLPYREYRQSIDNFYRHPLELLLTSRGCPYHCIFCASRQVSGHRYRFHSPEYVIRDIDDIMEKSAPRLIGFADDHFTLKKERAGQICDLIVERGHQKRMAWNCAMRADQADADLLKKMRRAGCRCICVGIESGSQRILQILRKDEKLEDMERGVRMIRKSGIMVRGTFVMGAPTETREETLATIAFARKLKLDFAQFNLIVPLPGTELFDIAQKEGATTFATWTPCAAPPAGPLSSSV
ncbi:MAG: radical SAM protein [Candidatus Aureabacteria bacterium]|nr:radical SAM protein [Candidatus Auribacterota bacterium]